MRTIKSLRNKFLRTLLLVTALGGLSTLVVVVVLSAQASNRQLSATQEYITEGISSKGRILTENHARALRGLTLDNAFLDIRRLVERAVTEDRDLVYGLYVTSERQTLAYSLRGLSRSDEQSPEANAFRALGIPDSELLARHETVRRTQRLGQDVLDVAAPVLGEEGEFLGTIRYGLSTQRMHEALARASEEAHRRLERSIGFVGVLILLSSSLGLLLSRAQAVRITKPIAELTQAAEGLARGDRSVRVNIDSGDELEHLGASFNRMVGDLDASYRGLEELNRTLEQKVEERTLELGRKNRDMRLVLDNVDQGFVTLGPDGKLALEHSRVVGAWFGEYDQPIPLWDYVGKSSRSFALQFRLGWEQVMEDLLPIEASLSQLPERLSSGNRTFSFRYLPFFRQNRLEGVLLVIAEITERLAKEREEADQNDLMQGFKKLMLDRSGFGLFLRDASEMVEAICTRRLENDLVTLKRTIHTLKGNSASMGLSVVARLCHALEEQLAENEAIPDAALAELFTRWKTLAEHIASFSGLNSQRVLEVPEAEYATLVARLSANGSTQPELLHQVLSWQLESVSRPLRRLAEQAAALARRLDKGEVQTEIQANEIRVDPDTFSPFFAELVHVIRNAVDHGLEPPDEREALGKPRHGTLILKAEQSAGTLNFEIGDDGRGIDWEAIAKKAKAQNLPCSTPEELTAALCADGITTLARATASSGRGVGMAALRQRVLKMNGRLEVRSVRGVGTNFIIRFPWPPADLTKAPGQRARHPR